MCSSLSFQGNDAFEALWSRKSSHQISSSTATATAAAAASSVTEGDQSSFDLFFSRRRAKSDVAGNRGGESGFGVHTNNSQGIQSGWGLYHDDVTSRTIVGEERVNIEEEVGEEEEWEDSESEMESCSDSEGLSDYD